MLGSVILDSNNNVTNWVSTGISSEKVKLFDTTLTPTMSILANCRANLKFNNTVFAQKHSSSLYSSLILNLYIVFELNNWPHNFINNFPLKSCLSDTVKLVRNANKNKFIYNGRRIVFDGEVSVSFGNNFAGNIIIFGVDNSSSPRTDNWKKNFLVLGEGPTDGINDSTDAAEKKVVLNLVKQRQNFA